MVLLFQKLYIWFLFDVQNSIPNNYYITPFGLSKMLLAFYINEFKSSEISLFQQL